MFRIGEYRPKADRLMDLLPWAGFIREGVVLNKDGSFQKTLTFRGPDLASSTQSSLMAVRAQLNNAFRRLGSRWCIHVEALRASSQTYPQSEFPDPVSSLIDEERRAAFEREDAHFESRYFLTFTYLPPEESIGKASSLLIENAPVGQGSDAMYATALRDFLGTIRQLGDILATIMPEVREMNDDETLTYLHSCISTKRHPVKAPEDPFYLDALLTDDDFQAGLFPKLGKHWMRTISVRGYPSMLVPGALDRLNSLGVSYRWVCRFLALDKEDARKELERTRKRWFAKRKGVTSLIKEALTKEPSALENTDAVNKAADVEGAMVTLGADAAGFGYFTPTITLMDRDPERLAAKVREVEAAINGAGFVAKVEEVNAVEAWLGSLPGHAYADIRRPLISTLNLCDMLPMSANWSGPVINAHLSAEAAKRGENSPVPPLLHARTNGTTPFRFDLHQGDVGHTMVIGPTGMGKSVLLNTIAMQWLRYSGAQVFIFDKGASSRAATRLAGGSFYYLGGERSALAFQPLAEIDTLPERQWAMEWLLDILAAEKLEITPHRKEEVWNALGSLASSPVDQRSMTTFSGYVQDHEIKQAIMPFTEEGAYGYLLDAEKSDLAASDWQAFEMEALMGSKPAVGPVLTYIFHMLEKHKFSQGRPTLLILDEAWLFLKSGSFAEKIEEWLRTLRKKNVSVIFATQSLNDVLNSPIVSALVESCPTRIFLSNPDAMDPVIYSLYERFGLNNQQIRLLTTATPKREYYYSSRSGNRMFELGLGPIALQAVASSSEADHKIMDEIEQGRGDFAPEFYARKGLHDVADFLRSEKRRLAA